MMAIVVLICVWYFINYENEVENCDSYDCFREKQRECFPVKHMSIKGEAVWDYEILGEKDGRCRIDVELKRIVNGTDRSKALEGMEMVCDMQLGFVNPPENNLRDCHGKLKEELQTITLENLYEKIRSELVGNESLE
jgi:hypothetical protein